jgi:hypothetical protein
LCCNSSQRKIFLSSLSHRTLQISFDSWLFFSLKMGIKEICFGTMECVCVCVCVRAQGFYFEVNYVRVSIQLTVTVQYHHSGKFLTAHTVKKKTPWSESTSELYRPSDRRLSAKCVPTFCG